MSYKKTIVVGFVLFGLVVLTALSTFYASLGKCPNGSLLCDSGTTCVPQKLVCNLVEDCEDGEDENSTMCGNLYGSNEVANSNFFEGMTRVDALYKMYNLTSYDDYMNYCAYERHEIPENCACMKVNLIRCGNNITRIPDGFPSEIAMIFLEDNQIVLRESDTFKSLQKLSYLNLGHNFISFIPPSLLYHSSSLRKLFLHNNHIRKLPMSLFWNTEHLVWLLLNHNQLHDFDLNIMQNLHSLQYLELSNNFLSLKQQEFPELRNLNELFIDFNNIECLGADLFKKLLYLTLISLRSNNIKTISKPTFSHLKGLQELRLSDNPIHFFDSRVLLDLPKLNALYLDNLRFPIDNQLITKLNVSFLSIGGISYNNIDFNAIEKMEKLKHIVFEKFLYCFMTPDFYVKMCRPRTDGISSNMDLLTNPILRYSAWLMALITICGNTMVLWSRFASRDENRSVSMVIRNLAVSDLIMGFYLAIIGFQDFRYRGVYGAASWSWLKSWGCTLAGILSMISSEVSIIILAFMSVERFLLISDPFGHHRLKTRNVILSLYIIWLIGVSIAVFPIIIFPSTKFYGIYNGGLCFPLFLQEKFPPGWKYSVFVFLGVNLTLLLLIATLYTVLLFSIWRTRQKCATTLDFFDCEFAIRFFFIVLTDSSCWVPIIMLKFLSLLDIEFSRDTYAWLVVFVLPLNSAVNPILYTFSTPKYRDQIYATFNRKSMTKKQESTSNQGTDESTNKISSLMYNNSISTNSSTSSRWMFLRKKS